MSRMFLIGLPWSFTTSNAFRHAEIQTLAKIH